jgi:glucokinase
MSYAVGVDIGGTKIHFAIVDEEGTIAEQHTVATGAALGPEHVMRNVLGGISRLISSGGVSIDGIGIGSAGQIDFRSGSVSFAVDTLPGWTGTPIKQIVENSFGLPVFVDNDVNVISIAEKCFGSAKGLDHFVCLALGTGVGGAVVESGKLLRGSSGGAGELGHISVDFNGSRCSCGNYGCLELYASGPSLARLAREAGHAFGKYGDEITAKEVIASWMDGDAIAGNVMDTAIRALASAIGGIIHTFNPQAIIIGGGVAEAGEPFFAALTKHAEARTSPSMWNDCRIMPASAGANAGVIGAAAQVWLYNTGSIGKRVSL